jgi:hypothetical protein
MVITSSCFWLLILFGRATVVFSQIAILNRFSGILGAWGKNDSRHPSFGIIPPAEGLLTARIRQELVWRFSVPFRLALKSINSGEGTPP